jgi:hypothetical protein
MLKNGILQMNQNIKFSNDFLSKSSLMLTQDRSKDELGSRTMPIALTDGLQLTADPNEHRHLQTRCSTRESSFDATMVFEKISKYLEVGKQRVVFENSKNH